jgi:rhodanese-related sulfurtransferase
MGNNISQIRNINFEDMKITTLNTSKQKNDLIINTLDPKNQECLIKGTVSIEEEILILNTQLNKDKNTRIIIYGMNACDYSIVKKYEQLIGLGFYNVYVYPGGLFEWLLLQDIYGFELFPTTKKENDLLKYKGHQQFNVKMLCN